MGAIAGLSAVLVCGLGLYLLALTAYTAWTLTHPPRRTAASEIARSRPCDPSELTPPRAFEERSVRAGGRALALWDVAGDDPSGAVVVCTPGWGDSKIGVLSRLEGVAPYARRVLAWDPPGLGESPGSCALGTREVSMLIEVLEQEAPGERAVLFGWSMGAGVSIAAAAREPGRALAVVAEAPYRVPATPARGVLKGRGLPHTVNLPAALWAFGVGFGVGPRWRGFDRAGLAAGVRCPVLVIHGEDDPVCPVGDGRAIAEAAGGTLVVTPGARHNDLWAERSFAPRHAEAVGRFLSGALARPGPRPTIPA